MATAAFRSTTGRSAVRGRRGAPSVADAGSSNRGGPQRRSRSLSRYSGRLAPPAPEHDEHPTSRGRFVEGARPSGPREISLDDLADEFFRARAESEEEDSEPASAHAHHRRSVAGYRMGTESSRQRGRSVSRPPDRRTEPLKGNSDGVLRRRRSVSLARHHRSDTENDITSHSSGTQVKSRTSGNAKLQQPSTQRPMKTHDDPETTRSHKDFFHSRHNYLAEKRKQDLLVELVEESRGVSNIIKDLLLSPEKSSAPQSQSRSRRRSNDRTRISKHLTKEAEKFFEDFLSNVEDTDISSFDGERSDTSSNTRCPGLYRSASESHKNAPRTASPPVDADDVLLPWLQWETSTDPPSCKSKNGCHVLPGNSFSSVTQEPSGCFSNFNQIASSFGSWSPEGNESLSAASSERIRSKFVVETQFCCSDDRRTRVSSFDMDEYTNLKQCDELHFERLRQRLRIDSGGMILCRRTLT